MPRKPTGQVFERGGRFFVRVTHQKERRSFPLESRTLDEAKKEAAAFAVLVALKGFPCEAREKAAEPTRTVSDWFASHFLNREAKGQTSVPDARSRFKTWIEPSIGKLPMRAVNRQHLETLVRELDAGVAKGKIKHATALKVWGEVTAAFREACESKRADLRVRDDFAAERVRGPDRGIKPQKPILYPAEVLALLACEAVPIQRRVIYAIAVYTAGRSSELEALEATSFDLANGRVHIEGQVDRRTKKTRETKTDRVRAFDLELALRPLVRILLEHRPSGRLLEMPELFLRAKLLREDLLVANVLRRELHHARAGRMHVVFHHLRDTGLTWMAARGDDALKIQFRGGHTDMKMTQAYIASARNLPATFGEPFPALPAAFLEKVEQAAPPRANARQRSDAPNCDAVGRKGTGKGTYDGRFPEMPGHSGELGWRPQRDSSLWNSDSEPIFGP